MSHCDSYIYSIKGKNNIDKRSGELRGDGGAGQSPFCFLKEFFK